MKEKKLNNSIHILEIKYLKLILSENDNEAHLKFSLKFYTEFIQEHYKEIIFKLKNSLQKLPFKIPIRSVPELLILYETQLQIII